MNKQDKIAEILEVLRGYPLTGQERESLELKRKIRDLEYIVKLPGWEVALEILQSYSQGSLRKLLNTAPGNNEQIIALHAEAYTDNRRFLAFIQDIDTMLSPDETVQDAVTQALKGAPTPVPPESII